MIFVLCLKKDKKKISKKSNTLKNTWTEQGKRKASEVVRFSPGSGRKYQVPHKPLSRQKEEHVQQTWGNSTENYYFHGELADPEMSVSAE